jgi:hypothetical protein
MSRSESGYQTQATFEDYVKTKLLKEIDKRGIERNKKNRIFYFVDGHKSHYSFPFCMWCRENFIVLTTFFPNATRILQMCDVGMFGSGKKSWVTEVQSWRIQNKEEEMNEVEFVKVLKKVNDKFITAEAIKNGFRGTGIHPLNVENVKFDRCLGTVTARTEDAPENFQIVEGESSFNQFCSDLNNFLIFL